jgi:hypothetical protein
MNRRDISYIQKIIDMEAESKTYITDDDIAHMIESGLSPIEVITWLREKYNTAMMFVQTILERDIQRQLDKEKEDEDKIY